MREIGKLTLQNYAKRNAFYSYIQSQGTVVNALTIMIYKNANALGMAEIDTNFWLYTQIFEHILPVGFYCQLMEPQVWNKIFIKLLNQIDPNSKEILGNVAELVFLRHFMNLYQEIASPSVQIAILDLLFLLGSGSYTATLSEPESVPVSNERPLCRTG